MRINLHPTPNLASGELNNLNHIVGILVGNGDGSRIGRALAFGIHSRSITLPHEGDAVALNIPESGVTENYFSKVYFHKLGEAQDKDALVEYLKTF